MDGDEAVKALVVKVLWFFREYSTSATLRSDAVEELQTRARVSLLIKNVLWFF